MNELENPIKNKIDVTVKLSILWVIIMFNMIYADILAVVSAFNTPGVVEELMRAIQEQ
jgi:hypothetical protein